MRRFSLSANIANGFAEGAQYIVTPNAQKAIHTIVNDYQTGIHSFTIIGSYGTGKSSFLLALESDLERKGRKPFLIDSKILLKSSDIEIKNIVGDYAELSTLLRRSLNVENTTINVLDELKSYYNKCQKQGKFLLIVIDEFGKVLEHAAKNNPEKELYFLQKQAEFVNVPSRQILLLTTLHQNFSAYAKGLTEAQVNEWKKVKGRFKEVTFVEPIEQLLHLAARQMQADRKTEVPASAKSLYELAKATGYVSKDFPIDTALQLYPLDLFSAYAITTAIQRYGQNERSLFTFLTSQENTPRDKSANNQIYNLKKVYDYIYYTFYSYLKEANTDSMNWSSMQVSIERVEGQSWDTPEQMLQAVNIIKAIGLLNLFSVAGFRLSKESLANYVTQAMHIPDAQHIIEKLEQKKIIRYAAYKDRVMLFEGTDVDLEAEIHDAGLMVSRPVAFVDELTVFFNHRISPVKAHFYQKGTPRFFDYRLYDAPEEQVPPQDFEVKKFAVDGVKLGFFNQYRRFINLGDEFTISKDSFIETIKPFLSFYVRLDDYTKHTHKFNHDSTMKFRDVLAKAKDPEKAFFEDLPEALGFNQEKLKQEEFIREYGNIIQRAIRELRNCYTGLIDRIEERLIDGFDLQSGDYNEYVAEIRSRLAHVKTYLLTDKQREFYHHVMTEYDNRIQWYQSICYTILEQRLETLRDKQEEKLVDDLIYMFRTCEKYSSISRETDDLNKNDAYSFDMVTNRGTDVRTQTYILPEKDKQQAADLEKQINRLLSASDENIGVCTLLAILNKRLK